MPHSAIDEIRWGLEKLRAAREHFRRAGAPKATQATRRAMKSAEGAERNRLCKMSRAIDAQFTHTDTRNA